MYHMFFYLLNLRTSTKACLLYCSLLEPPLLLASLLSSPQSCCICPEWETLQPKGLQQQLLYPAAPPRSVRSQPVCVCVYPSEVDEEPVITPHPLAAWRGGNKVDIMA